MIHLNVKNGIRTGRIWQRTNSGSESHWSMPVPLLQKLCFRGYSSNLQSTPVIFLPTLLRLPFPYQGKCCDFVPSAVPSQGCNIFTSITTFWHFTHCKLDQPLWCNSTGKRWSIEAEVYLKSPFTVICTLHHSKRLNSHQFNCRGTR